MSAHRIGTATRPHRRAFLWIVMASLLLVACDQIISPSPDPLERADRNYDRAQPFDIIPIDTTSDFTGVIAPWDGPCEFTVPIHGYDVGELGRAGADSTDSLTFDFWITTRCPGPWGVYRELLITFDARHPSFPDSHALDVWYGYPRGELQYKRVILHKSITTLVPKAFDDCNHPNQVFPFRASPPLQIPPIQTCRITGEPDSLRLRIRMEPPITIDPFDRGSEVWNLTIGLTDTDSARTRFEPHLFVLSSR